MLSPSLHQQPVLGNDLGTLSSAICSGLPFLTCEVRTFSWGPDSSRGPGSSLAETLAAGLRWDRRQLCLPAPAPETRCECALLSL